LLQNSLRFYQKIIINCNWCFVLLLIGRRKMFKQMQNYINFLIVCLIASNICFAQDGCTDPEAYNCEDSEAGEYENNIGGLEYYYSCDGNHAGPEDCSEGEICEGYYDSEVGTDDGSCRYPQAPKGNDVVITVEANGISVDWSSFVSPTKAHLWSYHVQRCIGDGCQWLSGTDPNLDDPNTSTSAFDDNDYDEGVEIKYAIAVKYSNNPYWGWAIGASYVTPCPELGDINGDGLWNVLDVVTLANAVLANTADELQYACAADLNSDSLFNVLDIVTLANCVLANNCDS